MRTLLSCLFELLVLVGKPIGGLRPRRLYHWLAHKAYARPRYSWRTTAYGCKMLLSPYHLVDRDIIILGRYDPPLHNFYTKNISHEMVCMDVGANIGDSTLHLAKLTAMSGAVYAFEPASIPLSRLKHHLTANRLRNIKLLPIAISDTIGKHTLDATTAEQENQGQSSIVNLNQESESARETVPTTTLDAFIEKEGLQRLDFIKIDIQGAEPLLLRGATKSLARFMPTIAMEVSPEDLQHIGETSRSLLELLEAKGYHAYTLRNNGSIGPRVHASKTPKDANFSNVICRPVVERTDERSLGT